MSLKMRIDTSYNGTGAKEAAKDIDKLDVKQKSASKSSAGLSNSTSKVGQSSSAASGMIGQLAGSLGAGGEQASKFSGAIGFAGAGVSALSTGVVGLASVLAAAAIGAWLKWQNKVKEAKETLKKFRAELKETEMAVQQSEIDSLSAIYKDLSVAIDQASAAQAKLNQAMAAAENVEKAERMALLDLEEARALNNLPAEDSLARSETSSSFATKRRELGQEYQERSSSRVAETMVKALKDAMAKENVAETAIMKNRQKLTDVDEQQSLAKAALSRLYRSETPMKTIDIPVGYNPSGMPLPGQSGQMQVVDKAKQQEEADIIRKNLYGEKGLEKQSKELKETIAKLSSQYAANRVETNVAQMNAESASRQHAATSGINPQINTVTTRADNIQNRAGRQQQLNQANDKMASLKEQEQTGRTRETKEMNEWRIATPDNSTPKQIAQQMQEWRDATAALNKLMSEIGPMMKETKETADRATQALNNLP